MVSRMNMKTRHGTEEVNGLSPVGCVYLAVVR
ncbi:hypothetical protein E2C01_038120 [Portunus trituberculatus]|uniref:Uncharacterized protein n=1 Tax=Portunus trituberculatus TaxID=210409 RepID=A0A5B7FFZ2_PORTR|nr:hypothetical protein [Portunus trituberculatus]